MLHTKHKLGASGNDCLLCPREQDTEAPTEVSPRNAFRFLASADIRKHPKGQTIAQGKELPRELSASLELRN